MFHICTIANNLSQYAAMKSSFLQAGFDEEHCRYELFDNSVDNRYDPYQTISQVLSEATEPYVIFCHQDILLNKGHGFDQLVSQLENLNQRDTKWAISGNAGYTEDFTLIVKVDDPNGVQNYGELPQKVYSLDENFLVIRTASHLYCSPNLSGFHLYATDLCLQAMQRNLSCYVIDFYLTHLSAGNSESEDFQQGLVKFRQNWNSAFLFCLIHTPCTFFYLSRIRILHRILTAQRGMGWVRRNVGVYTQIARAKRLVQQKYRRFQ